MAAPIVMLGIGAPGYIEIFILSGLTTADGVPSANVGSGALLLLGVG